LIQHFEEYPAVDDVLNQVLVRIRVDRRIESLPTARAYGRISAQELTAPTDVPEFAASHMDGFAVIAHDLLGAMESSPVTLMIKGHGKLGEGSTPRIRHGEAIRVATGGRIPIGADTVLPVESAEETKKSLLVSSPAKPGSFVYKAGEDVRRGETILSRAQTIRAQDVGLLVGLGFTRIKVWRQPRVSVIATGSELTDSDKPRPGEVRNSHSPVFLGLSEAQGCTSLDKGVVGDDSRAIAQKINNSLADSDFVMTLGGTSVGRHDVVGDAVAKLHPTVVFHGIGMDRGRVTGIAVVKGKAVLMMPGPIQGAMNAFVLFGIPIINLLSGRKEPTFEIPARMGEDWEARTRFASFQKIIYVKLRVEEEVVALPLLAETESLKILTEADGYVSIPKNIKRIPKGSRVTVRLVPGFSPR
jgi:molybdopterin molybdotransferase